MSKLHKNLPIYLFVLLTILNYILGTFEPSFNNIIGACSTVHLFILAYALASKLVIFLDIFYSLAFVISIIWCVRIPRTKKVIRVFTILLLIDVLISFVFLMHGICNNAFVIYNDLDLIFGIVLRILFIIWQLKWYKSKTNLE